MITNKGRFSETFMDTLVNQSIKQLLFDLTCALEFRNQGLVFAILCSRKRSNSKRRRLGWRWNLVMGGRRHDKPLPAFAQGQIEQSINSQSHINSRLLIFRYSHTTTMKRSAPVVDDKRLSSRSVADRTSETSQNEQKIVAQKMRRRWAAQNQDQQASRGMWLVEKEKEKVHKKRRKVTFCYSETIHYRAFSHTWNARRW